MPSTLKTMARTMLGRGPTLLKQEPQHAVALFQAMPTLGAVLRHFCFTPEAHANQQSKDLEHSIEKKHAQIIKVRSLLCFLEDEQHPSQPSLIPLHPMSTHPVINQSAS